MSLLHTSEIPWKKSELSKMSFQEKNHCQKHSEHLQKLEEEIPQRSMWWNGESHVIQELTLVPRLCWKTQISATVMAVTTFLTAVP